MPVLREVGAIFRGQVISHVNVGIFGLFTPGMVGRMRQLQSTIFHFLHQAADFLDLIDPFFSFELRYGGSEVTRLRQRIAVHISPRRRLLLCLGQVAELALEEVASLADICYEWRRLPLFAECHARIGNGTAFVPGCNSFAINGQRSAVFASSLDLWCVVYGALGRAPIRGHLDPGRCLRSELFGHFGLGTELFRFVGFAEVYWAVQSIGVSALHLLIYF
jgi:hypothetical protein